MATGGSARGEERRVAVGLAVFFAAVAAVDVPIVAFAEDLRLPAVLLLVYLLSLIAVLLFDLRRRRTRGSRSS